MGNMLHTYHKPTVYNDLNNPIFSILNSFIKDDTYNFVQDVNKLPKKYTVQINVWNVLNDKRFCNVNFQNNHKKLVFPERIKKDIKQGNVHVVFNLTWESCYTLYGNDKLAIDFNNFSNIYACPIENITFLIANHNITKHHTGVNTVVYNHPMMYTGTGDMVYDAVQSEDKILSLLNKNLLPYNGLFYTRRAREERLAILYSLSKLGVLDKINYSCLLPPVANDRLNKYFKQLQLPDLQEILKEIKIPTTCKFSKIKSHDPEHATPFVNDIDWGHSLTSSFQIVVESYPDSPGFVTEKSIKPFRMLQPFVTYGSVGTVEYLKSLGYDVFEDIVDHSYDNIQDNHLRLKTLIKEIERLSNMSQEQWSTTLYTIIDRLISNANKATSGIRFYHTGDLELYEYCKQHESSL